MSIINLENITKELIAAKKIAIAGHIRPDGDCIGSCTALYLYLMNNCHELGIEQVDVYLEPFERNLIFFPVQIKSDTAMIMMSLTIYSFP